MKTLLISFFIFYMLLFVSCYQNQMKTDLLASNFEGSWRILYFDSQHSSTFTKFDGNQGNILVYFTDFGHKTEKIQGVILEFLMPKYYDQKVLKIIINFENSFREQYKRWQGSTKAYYQYFDSIAKSQTGQIQLQYIADQNIIGLSIGQNFSLICSFHKKYINPSTSFIFAVVAFFVLVIVRRKNSINDTRIRHQAVPIILSTVMLLVISIVEIIIGFRSLFGIMNPQAFFTVAGLINLAVCHQILRFYGFLILRRQLILIAIWVLSCIYIWFLLYFRHNFICLILNSLIFLPQIGYHCLRGQKIQMDGRFIFIVLSNQIYVLYFKSCPENIFRQSPNYLVGYCISSMLIVQIGLLLGQIHIGPRFFIPSILLPPQHNYYDQKQAKIIAKSGLQCYICLEQIKFGKDSSKSKKVMVTPCQHIFHALCLQKWMVVQMKCPVDRSDLPPL